MPALLRLTDGVLSVVLAPPCAACGTPLSQPTRGPVCQECWNGIARFAPPLCNHCGDPLLSWRKSSDGDGRCVRCRQHSSPVTSSRAIGPYDGTLRAILHAFKYGGCRSLSRGLGELLRESAADILAAVDLAVPVPLHRSRHRARGFNQARELARHLGVPLGRCPAPDQGDSLADGSPGRGAAWQRLRRIRRASVDVACECRWSSSGARRRCEHDRRHDRSVRDGFAGGWRRRRQRGDGSTSRVSTA